MLPDIPSRYSSKAVVNLTNAIRLLIRTSVTRLGDLLDFGQLFKPLATINLPKSLTFLGNFCVGDKIYHFSSEIIFGNFYRHLAIFFWSHDQDSRVIL